MNILQCFNQSLDQHHSLFDEGANFSKRMYLIEMMLYGYAEKLGEVDFSTFTASDLRTTINDIMGYESDEISDHDFGEDRNLGNPIYELNSLAGLTKEVLSIKPLQKKKRRFF